MPLREAAPRSAEGTRATALPVAAVRSWRSSERPHGPSRDPGSGETWALFLILLATAGALALVTVLWMT